MPAVSLGSSGLTAYEYDELSRVTKATGPDGAASTTNRVDLKTVVTNPDGKVSHTVVDTLGRTVETRVMEGVTAVGKMTYTYRADGLLLTSRDSVGNVTTMSYDNLGRRLTLQDPDAGLATNARTETRLQRIRRSAI